MRIVKGLFIALLCIVMMLSIGCDQTQMHKAAQATAAISTSLKGAQDFNVTLYRTGQISKDETIAIAIAINDASLANDQFVAKLRTLNKIDSSNKDQVLIWIEELSASVEKLNQTGVLHIKNAESKQRFTLTIAALQASIEIIRTAVQ